MVTLAIVLVVLGILGFVASFMVVYKPAFVAQLSMSALTGAVKEHHSGISFKVPWATMQGSDISMKSEVIVTSGGILVMDWEDFISQKVYERIAPRIYETADSVLYGSWATAIRPQEGHLAQMMKKTPQVAALMAMAEVDLTVSDYLATQLTAKVLHEKKDISKIVATVFGGDADNASSEFEREYGVVVSNPQLFDLNYGKKSQDAAEDVFAAKKFKEGLEQIKSEMANDPEKAVNALLMYLGKGVQKHIYNIEGLEGAVKSVAEAFVRSKS